MRLGAYKNLPSISWSLLLLHNCSGILHLITTRLSRHDSFSKDHSKESIPQNFLKQPNGCLLAFALLSSFLYHQILCLSLSRYPKTTANMSMVFLKSMLRTESCLSKDFSDLKMSRWHLVWALECINSSALCWLCSASVSLFSRLKRAQQTSDVLSETNIATAHVQERFFCVYYGCLLLLIFS